RAAGPLRVAAAVRALATAVGVVSYVISWLWPWDSSGSIESVVRRVEIVAAAQRWSAVGCAGVMLIALALMFSALERRARALAAGAVAATAFMLALMVFNELARGQIVRITPNHFLALLEAIWFMQLVASHAGPLLALLAAAAAVPAAP